MKNKLVFIIAGGLIVLMGGGLIVKYYVDKNKLEKGSDPSTTGSGSGGAGHTSTVGEPPSGSTVVGTPQVGDSFPLKVGSRGYAVAKLQSMLNKVNASSLDVDGVFGAATASGMNDYLPFYDISCLLAATCSVDLSTFSALEKAANGKGFADYWAGIEPNILLKWKKTRKPIVYRRQVYWRTR